MFLEQDQVSIYYEVHGTGEPIVLLHGNGEDHTYFKHQVPYLLTCGFQVILIDMRGHGASSLGNQDLDFPLFAQDVIAVCDEQRIDQFHVLGFSDGANTAMQLGISYPDRIRSMILNSGNIHPKGMCRKVYRDIQKAYVKTKVLAAFDPAHQKEVQLLQLMYHHPKLISAQLQRLSMPVLVIAGTKDMIEEAHTRAIAHAIPHVSLVLLPQGDHFIAQNRSDEFNKAIGIFLKENLHGE